MITIRPHHFLDIIKLYGSGLEKFVPDREFGHDFWRVGNLILENHQVELKLVVGADDICKPCKFLKKGNCLDGKKQVWNKVIDERILEKLGFEKNAKIKAIDFASKAKKLLRKRDIFEIWKERPFQETEKRAVFLLRGFCRYCGI